MTTQNTPMVLGLTVDALGLALAQKAEMGAHCDALKADLIGFASSLQRKAFEGDLFRATVTFADKVKTDWRAVVAEIAALSNLPADVQEEIIARHTERAEGVPTVRCTARKG